MRQNGTFVPALLGVIAIAAIAILPLITNAERKCGPYDGVDLTDDPELLEKILNDHQEWLDSDRREDDLTSPCRCEPYRNGWMLPTTNASYRKLSSHSGKHWLSFSR